MRTLGLILTTVTLVSGCAPLIIGAGAAIVADEVAENRQGGDGLF